MMHRRIHCGNLSHRGAAVVVLPPVVVFLVVAGMGMRIVPAFSATEIGALQVIVRDGDGHPLPEVHLLLYHDADSGAEMLQHVMTDPTGQVTFTNLAYGLYIVQFHGMLPGGRPIEPVARQNAGLEVDGGGTVNGFGIRLAQPHLTQLFVMMGTREADPAAAAMPLFDLA